jgi:hypothetical protein
MASMDLQSAGGEKPGASPDRGSSRKRSRGVLAVPLRARLWLGGAGLAAVALVIVLLSTTTGNGSELPAAGAAAARVTTASLATFHRALVSRLDRQHARYHWVACVRSGKRFAGVPIVRCNVNFGDPHIQAYCSVFRGGSLLTSQEDPAIPCGHDDAGYSFTMETFR